MKKIKYLLNQFDFLWSVPLAFIIFWLVGIVLTSFFGRATGTYDLAFIQPLFLSIAIVVGATNAAIIGLWFNFRGLFKWLYGYRGEDGNIINNSKINWDNLTTCQKYIITLFVFFYFVSAVIAVYLKMI